MYINKKRNKQALNLWEKFFAGEINKIAKWYLMYYLCAFGVQTANNQIQHF